MAEPYCVIGDPIAHSISPPIHKAAFAVLGKNDDYEAIHVPGEALPNFLISSRENQRPGFNITIPHKETVIPLLDEVDSSALNIGAVNTVVNKNGIMKGYNTDVSGCISALKLAGLNTSGGKVLVLGAGGAARAGIEASARLGFAGCVIFDIVTEKSDTLVKHFSALHSFDIKSTENPLSELGEYDLIINASPVGMWPHADVSPLSSLADLNPETIVFDMVYTPLETRLMKESAKIGAKAVSGLSMLVAQALEADALFFDTDLPDELFDHVYSVAHKIMSDRQPK